MTASQGQRARNPPERRVDAHDSERIQACSEWLGQMVGAVRLARLYSSRGPGPALGEARGQVFASLTGLLVRFGPLTLRIAPGAAFVGDQNIVPPAAEGDEIGRRSGEEQLATLMFVDGIRQLRFAPGLPRADLDALIDALRDAGTTTREHEDLVTLLWQAAPTHLELTVEPPQRTIFHSFREFGRGATGTPDFAAHGIPNDRFDDRPLPDAGLDVGQTFRELQSTAEASRARLIDAWRLESGGTSHQAIGSFLRDLLALDSGPEMRRAVSRYIVSWLPDSIAHGHWDAARYSLALLAEVEPDPAVWNPVLAGFLAKLDPVPLAERLERSEGAQVSAFIEVALAIGPTAVDLVCAIMAEADEPASRAAAEVALAILCAEDPTRLEPYLYDPRWYVVRNAAQVLGMVGGEGVGRLLSIAIANSDERVVREAIRSLARAPREEGLPVLIALLHSRDLQVLGTTLSVLARDKNPAAARALLARIESPEFESEEEELQRQVFTGLAEIGGDESVFALSSLVQQTGLFVHKTLIRSSAAQALARIGTSNAMVALAHGLESKHEAVRLVCREAMGGGA